MQDSFIFFILVGVFLVSLTAFFQRPSPLFLRVSPVYLLITILVQQIGNYMSLHAIHNATLYNAYSIFEFLFYFFTLREIIVNKKIKTLILILMIIYPLVPLFNIVYAYNGNDFHSKTYAIGCILIVAFCIVYFVELFQLPKAPKLKNEPAFWICTAILFNYVCTFPFWGLVNFMNTAPMIVINNLMTILMIINILSYLLFTIAFLCRIKIRKSTL